MLADVLREGTRDLHRRVEMTGIIAGLLSGQASLGGYVLYLRNLFPIYESLDRGLVLRRDLSGWLRLAVPPMQRSAAIRADLESLYGREWAADLPELPAAAAYRERVVRAAAGHCAGFAAHVYTRLLGDLNGGRILARRLESMFGLGSDSLQFYRFSLGRGIRAFTREYRHAFDDLELGKTAVDAALTETRMAFRLNMTLSEQVLAPVGSPASGAG